MFFDAKIDRIGVWVLWGLLALALAGQGCAFPERRDNMHRRGLLDWDRTPVQNSAPRSASEVVVSETGVEDALPLARRAEFKKNLTPQREIASAVEHTESQRARFEWPLSQIHITSTFGKRSRGEVHQGLDLRAAVGTPVYAAHTGKVIYSGSRISGYGKLVVIKDSAGVSTIYAHNSRLLVLPGQQVRAGAKIALSGASGTVRGPHLHFEVRKGVTPVDPRKLLPAL